MGFRTGKFNPFPAVWLALSLIRVPKLFITLLLWPLVIGVGLAATQVVFTASFVQLLDEDTTKFQERINRPDPEDAWLRSHIYGRTEPFPALKVCRWKLEQSTGTQLEVPPEDGCAITPNEVAIHVEDPEAFNSSLYEQFFTGTIAKLHICRNCKTDVILSLANNSRTENESNLYSIKSLGIFLLADSAHDKEVNDKFIQAKSLI